MLKSTILKEFSIKVNLQFNLAKRVGFAEFLHMNIPLSKKVSQSFAISIPSSVRVLNGKGFTSVGKNIKVTDKCEIRGKEKFFYKSLRNENGKNFLKNVNHPVRWWNFPKARWQTFQGKKPDSVVVIGILMKVCFESDAWRDSYCIWIFVNFADLIDGWAEYAKENQHMSFFYFK